MGRLGVAFKGLAYFCHAHQDFLCALVLLVQRPKGTRIGELQHDHAHWPRGWAGSRPDVLRAQVPNYEAWYRRWRNARNEIKRGAAFGAGGTIEECEVTFTVFSTKNGETVGNSEVIRLGDLIEALDMSTELQRATARRATEQSRLAPPQRTMGAEPGRPRD